jgi:uncharacterized ferritin-like protein (DUF455 family)
VSVQGSGSEPRGPADGGRLPPEPARARMMRIDSVQVLTRWLQLERALVLACAGWVPAARRLDTKALLARTAWQSSLTAEALRRRVLELRYPERNLGLDRGCPLVALYEAASAAPGPGALLHALGGVLIPALRSGFERYLEASDDIADGPTRRLLNIAVEEMRDQVQSLNAAAGLEGDSEDRARAWSENLGSLVEEMGGVGLDRPRDVVVEPVVPPGKAFRPVGRPGRDDRYVVMSFYWPDNLDPSYSYGHGIRLQLRSAISHLNEVWAVDTAAAILWHFGRELGWDFLSDGARWLYDESRHMMMGARRLEWWGFKPHEIPLGSYIIESLEGQDPIYSLAMLAFFETKNIGKKRSRAQELGGLGDLSSQRDMDFDWADEAIHTGYGRRWLKAALKGRGRDPNLWPTLVARCEELVRARVDRASDEEAEKIKVCAASLVARAEELAAKV